MIYYKDSTNGSGSSDSDHTEGKKNGDACEGNVYNVDVESRNLVDHIGNRFQPNPKYLSCHAFSHHEVGIAGEEGKIITDDDKSLVRTTHAKQPEASNGREDRFQQGGEGKEALSGTPMKKDQALGSQATEDQMPHSDNVTTAPDALFGTANLHRLLVFYVTLTSLVLVSFLVLVSSVDIESMPYSVARYVYFTFYTAVLQKCVTRILCRQRKCMRQWTTFDSTAFIVKLAIFSTLHLYALHVNKYGYATMNRVTSRNSFLIWKSGQNVANKTKSRAFVMPYSSPLTQFGTEGNGKPQTKMHETQIMLHGREVKIPERSMCNRSYLSDRCTDVLQPTRMQPSSQPDWYTTEPSTTRSSTQENEVRTKIEKENRYNNIIYSSTQTYPALPLSSLQGPFVVQSSNVSSSKLVLTTNEREPAAVHNILMNNYTQLNVRKNEVHINDLYETYREHVVPKMRWKMYVTYRWIGHPVTQLTPLLLNIDYSYDIITHKKFGVREMNYSIHELTRSKYILLRINVAHFIFGACGNMKHFSLSKAIRFTSEKMNHVEENSPPQFCDQIILRRDRDERDQNNYCKRGDAGAWCVSIFDEVTTLEFFNCALFGNHTKSGKLAKTVQLDKTVNIVDFGGFTRERICHCTGLENHVRNKGNSTTSSPNASGSTGGGRSQW